MKKFLEYVKFFAAVNIYNSVGRINRMQYLKYKIALFAFGLILILTALLIGNIFNLIAPIVGFIATGFLMIVVAVPIFLVDILLGVRRLHDMNLTGWFMVLMFIPYVNLLFTAFLFCWKGTEGKNEYDIDLSNLPDNIEIQNLDVQNLDVQKVSLVKKVSQS